MAQELKVRFPWKAFSLWLREGILGASFLNKLMIASGKDSNEQSILPVGPEEARLLLKLQAEATEKGWISQEDSAKLDAIKENLTKGQAYLSGIQKEELLTLWLAFTEYGIHSERYHTLRDPIIQSFDHHSENIDNPVTALMDRVWRSLGPGTAPSLSLIEGEEQKEYDIGPVVSGMHIALKEKNLLDTFLNSNDPEVLYSLDGIIIDINEVASAMLGWKKDQKDQIIGIHFSNLTTAQSSVLVKERIEMTLLGKKMSPSYEVEIKRKDGTLRTLSARTRIIRNRTERIGFWTSYLDITERKKAEDALKEIISDHAFALRIDPDLTSSIEWTSESLKNIIGYSIEELRVFHQWEDLIHPDDRILLPKISQALSANKNDVSILRVRRKDGLYIWLRISLYPVWDEKENRLVRIFGAAQDMTVPDHAFSHFTYSLARATDIRTIADLLFAITKNLLKAEYGFLLVMNSDKTTLDGVAAFGPGVEFLNFSEERVDLQDEYAPVVPAFAEKRLIVIKDFANDPNVSIRLSEKYHFIRGNWVAPFMSGEEAIGVFGVGYSVPKTPSEEERRILQFLVDGTSQAVERARLTDQIREQEGLFETVFKNVTDGIALIDLKTQHFLRVNPAYLEIFGYSENELVDRRMTYLDITNKEDQAASINVYRSLLEGNIVPEVLVKNYRHKSGKIIRGRLTAALPQEHEKPQFFISMVKRLDGSELSESLSSYLSVLPVKEVLLRSSEEVLQ